MATTTTHDRSLAPAGPLIDGDWVQGTSGGSAEHVDPATGAVNGTVALAGVAEAEAAIAAARAASAAWRAVSGDQRRKLLQRVEALIESHCEELAQITSRELGLPLPVARAHGLVCAGWFGYYAGWADKIEGATIPLTPSANTGFDYTLREPYGVIGLIITWNGPLASIGMKVAPALAAGNCVVLKTPDLAPFAAARFAELALEAGLPPGVLHVLPGGPEPAQLIVGHPDVAKISFTGGLATARKILHDAAELAKPVVLELGGKSANLIFADADLDAAAAHAFASCLGSAGQECAFPSRVLVERAIYDEVLDRALRAVDGLVIGDPLAAGTQVGPVVSAVARERILATVNAATAGAAGRLIAGGGRVDPGRLGSELSGGFYVEPTVLADVDVQSDLAQHEVFGPVISVMPFDDEDEAVTIANGTEYGLAATVHTREVTRVHRLASALAAGSVRFNGGLMLPPGVPFGGYKRSGIGREGGRAGLDEFLQTKNVAIRF